MKRFLLYLLLLCTACAKDDPAPVPPTPVERTLLVYMAGDNNLASDGRNNLVSITATMQGYSGDARTIVYLDTPGENPRLIDVTPSGQAELYRWPSPQNSASESTLREVIALTRELAPAARYGLILWSHGVAWLPSSAQGYLTRSMGRESDPWPATKWFGQDTSASPAGYLDTEDLAAAIPDALFDYILFDACYMASVEVLYALRRKADHIIAAPTEVISTGFPYGAIVRPLLQETPDLEAVCRSFFNFYAQHPDPRYRSATVSMVKTSELEGLASATAELYAQALAADPEVFSGMKLAGIQHLDRYRRHFLFDQSSIVLELGRQGGVSQGSVAAWQAQLARTVLYEAHTPAFFDLPLAECCGLSCFVPVEAYADLNDYYASLEWCVATNGLGRVKTRSLALKICE